MSTTRPFEIGLFTSGELGGTSTVGHHGAVIA